MEHTRAVRGITLAALFASGCTSDGRAPKEAASSVVPAATLAPAAPSERMKSLGYTGPARAQSGGTSVAGFQLTGLEAMAASRKLIRTGQMTLVVDDFTKASDEVKRIAESNGGYLADAQAARGAQDRRHGSLTIRVDAARFDAAVAAVRALGDVRSENVGAQDVTKAYADLETRLAVKRETAGRLRDILRTRTARLSDILEAEGELARVTEEIEQMEGERRFYDQQIALSTLTVALQEPSAVVEAGMFAPVKEALRDSVRVLVASLAALVYAAVFLTPWLLLALIAWLLFRRARARRAAAISIKP